MLPERGAGARERASAALDGRYGDEALALLLAGGPAYGCVPAECEVKLFGGGACSPAPSAGGDALQVHLRNIEQALARQHGLRVVAQHLGGQGYRQLRLDLPSGDVWMRFSLRGAG
jgi:chemotaxis protein CheD